MLLHSHTNSHAYDLPSSNHNKKIIIFDGYKIEISVDFTMEISNKFTLLKLGEIGAGKVAKILTWSMVKLHIPTYIAPCHTLGVYT